jgi:ABC-type thiamin/hydroxymethylpyrimidine transport system permease subunit
MKIETVTWRKHGKTATIDLVTMALFASLGIATKNIIYPMAATITGPLYIPAGSVAGGIFMMWPIIAYGLVRKVGAATTVALIQASISLLMPFGNFGLLTFLVYLAPGLAIDGVFLVSNHKACCAGCCLVAAAIANAVGTLLVGLLILALPSVALLFTVMIAAISGGIGGVIANMLLHKTRKMGVTTE